MSRTLVGEGNRARPGTARIPGLGLAAVLLLAAAADAQPHPRPAEEQRVELVRALGEDTWAAMPLWRQRMLEFRFTRFLRLPPEAQAEIRRAGLKAFLLQAAPHVDPGGLPEALREEIARLPERARPRAIHLAFLRMRQLQLDRSLDLVPSEKRWEVFERRFPEPYDHGAARAGHEELKAWVAKAAARRIAKELEARGELDAEESRRLKERLFAEEARGEQDRLVQRLRREIFRSREGDARRVDVEDLEVLEHLPFVTPRQRELIRYALHPEDCPLLDLSFLGPRPDDPAERRRWEWDRVVLGRVELLLLARFPREMALHLAAAGSPAELLRALRRLRRLPD